jgi:cytochrome c-type biogenesis protein CcmE
MKPRHKRMALIVAGLATLGLAATLVLNAFRSNMVFFFTPSQIAAHEAPAGRSLRIGGLVVVGSIKREGVKVHFIVTDTAQSIPVVYTGILPDLFKEGKGVVAEGELGANGVFQATQVLAKHDENYMPPEAAEALKRARASGESTGKSLVMETESTLK